MTLPSCLSGGERARMRTSADPVRFVSFRGYLGYAPRATQVKRLVRDDIRLPPKQYLLPQV